MSWNEYITRIEDSAGGGANCDNVCIVGLADGSPWTNAEHPKQLNIAPQEVADITKCFNSRDFGPFRTGGVIVGGKKYNFLREMDDKTVMAKKQGIGGIVLQKTGKTVIIAHCPEGGQLGGLNTAVGKIGEYLETSGF